MEFWSIICWKQLGTDRWAGHSLGRISPSQAAVFFHNREIMPPLRAKNVTRDAGKFLEWIEFDGELWYYIFYNLSSPRAVLWRSGRLKSAASAFQPAWDGNGHILKFPCPPFCGMMAYLSGALFRKWQDIAVDAEKRGYYHKTAAAVLRKLSNISWNLFTVILEKSVNLC